MLLRPEEWMAIWLSLKVSIVAVAVSLPFAILIGYWLARSSSRIKLVVESIVYAPLVMPPVVTGFLLLVLLGRSSPLGTFLESINLRVTFTWLGAVVAAAVISFPLVVRSIRSAFQAIDPRLEAAAKSLGASQVDAFFSISLPLAMRGVIAGAILGFARSLGEFGATVMVAGNIPGVTQTIPLAVFSFVQRPGGIMLSWRLVIISIVIACGALFMSEWLDRRGKQRESISF